MIRKSMTIWGMMLCLCLMTGMLFSVNAAENLAVNVDAFTLSGGASIANGEGPSGENALVLEGEDAEAYFYVENLEANKTYGFSAKLKSNKDGAAAIKVEAVKKENDAYSAVAAVDSMQHYKYTAGTDTYVSTGNVWRDVQFNFTLPALANAAKITVSCKEGGETVSFADFDVYVAANLVSNGDFEGVSVYDANPTTSVSPLTLATTGTASNWRFKKGDITTNNVRGINDYLSSGITLQNADGAQAQGYIYGEKTSNCGISQVIPVKTNQMYRLSFDWGVWINRSAAVFMGVYISSARNTYWVYDNVETGTFSHHEYYFFIPESSAITDGMTEICLYWNDNGGAGRTILDNVILEPVNNTVTTRFSEKYAALDKMPEGGDTTVTVKNTYRIPKDASNDGSTRVYKNFICLYKIENDVPVLVKVNMETASLISSTTADSIKTITLDVPVPAIAAGEKYKIVSFTWDGNLTPRVTQTELTQK